MRVYEVNQQRYYIIIIWIWTLF